MDNKEEKLREIAEKLYDMAQHNRITNFHQWNERMFELLDEAFPEMERVGEFCAEVDDIAHDRHDFGWCDLCGCYINFATDPWTDLSQCDTYEREMAYKCEHLRKMSYSDICSDDRLEHVCELCFHDIATEQGFRDTPLFDSNIITDRGGKSHATETLGEFLDEQGDLDINSPAEEISFALLMNGLEPLMTEHIPFINDAEKMRDFRRLPKERFLESYSYLTENEYKMTKRVALALGRDKGEKKKITITLTAEMDYDEFQNQLGMDDQFDLVDSIIYAMDYNGEGVNDRHNGITIRAEVEDLPEKSVDTK